MQYTPNYNMTIAEGTDVVNPLTQIFPNFEEIDTQMYANKNAGIGTATEVTTGTVHAITRANTNNAVFRFTATSSWVLGDTMTVDGVSVTVHATNGESLVNGAYIIGAEVFCILNGTLVTMINSIGAISAAEVSYGAGNVKLALDALKDLALFETDVNSIASGFVRIPNVAGMKPVFSSVTNLPPNVASRGILYDGTNYYLRLEELVGGSFVPYSTIFSAHVVAGYIPA